VAAGADAVFVKVSPSTRDYEREVRGYVYAARALAAHEAPRLLASDPDLQVLMTSRQPGNVVRGLPLDVVEEQRVYELAGHLLWRWHDHSDAASDQVREDIRASMANQAEEAAACLESTAGHLDNAQRDLVRCVSRELPELAEEVPAVYRHGDYLPIH
jgi:hypothetical protein